MNDKSVATKFAKWDVPELDKLAESKIYILRENLNKGFKLSAEEKAYITKLVNTNSYFKDAVPLWGWKFDFSDVLKKFVVRQYGVYCEYLGFDRPSVRKMLYGKIEVFLEG